MISKQPGVKLVAGLYPPSAGTIAIQDTHRAAGKHLVRLVAYGPWSEGLHNTVTLYHRPLCISLQVVAMLDPPDTIRAVGVQCWEFVVNVQMMNTHRAHLHATPA